MDIATDSGASLHVRGFPGGDRFGLLTVRDLGELQRRMPLPEQERWYVDPFSLFRWGQTAEGSLHVLQLSAARIGREVTVEEVEKWGGVVSRQKLAAAIMAESLVSGEEPDPPQPRKPEEAKAPAPFVTGWLRRFFSRTMPQGSAIRSA